MGSVCMQETGGVRRGGGLCLRVSVCLGGGGGGAAASRV